MSITRHHWRVEAAASNIRAARAHRNQLRRDVADCVQCAMSGSCQVADKHATELRDMQLVLDEIEKMYPELKEEE